MSRKEWASVGGMAAFHLYLGHRAWIKSVPALAAYALAAASVAGMVVQTTLGQKEYDVTVCGPLSFILAPTHAQIVVRLKGNESIDQEGVASDLVRAQAEKL